MNNSSDSEQPTVADARYETMTEYLDALQKDAARWRYVRDRLAIHHGEGSDNWFSFQMIRGAGHSFTKVIDKLIAAEREKTNGG